jgi:transmembrane sensor
MTDPRRDAPLPVPLARLIDQGAPGHVHELWLELAQRRTERLRKSGARARTWLSVAACFVVLLGSSLALSTGLSLPGASERPLLSAEGAALPARMQTLQPYQAFDLNDGSRITVVRGARLDVLESSPRTVALALRSGRARFDVRPHGPRAWRIDCGPYAVEVVGTKFVLDRAGGGLRVDVLHGAVLVRGEGIPDGVQRLNAGQSLQAPGKALAEAAAPTRKPMLLPLTVVSAPEPAQAQETRPLLPEPSAHPLAGSSAGSARRRGRSAQALADGGDSVDALFRDADKARLEGRLADAVVSFRRILEQHADDSRAALAGFALGRLQLAALGRPDLAAQNFKLALSLGLPAALSEDAYGKLAEAYAKAGERSAACSAWNEYARRFPQGAKLAHARAQCQVVAPQ